MTDRRSTKRTLNGSKWIRPDRRLGIYLRDNMACVYCGKSCNEESLCLDHFKPRFIGGGNHSGNLVTACIPCNLVRGARPVLPFVRKLADELNFDAKEIYSGVLNARRRKVRLKEARAFIQSHGTYMAALHRANPF